MTPQIAHRIIEGDCDTDEQKRMAGCYLWRKRHFPGDRGLLLPERHPAIVERNRPLMTTIGERLVTA